MAATPSIEAGTSFARICTTPLADCLDSVLDRFLVIKIACDSAVIRR
jgi:hypothetical protein